MSWASFLLASYDSASMQCTLFLFCLNFFVAHGTCSLSIFASHSYCFGSTNFFIQQQWHKWVTAYGSLPLLCNSSLFCSCKAYALYAAWNVLQLSLHSLPSWPEERRKAYVANTWSPNILQTNEKMSLGIFIIDCMLVFEMIRYNFRILKLFSNWIFPLIKPDTLCLVI